MGWEEYVLLDEDERRRALFWFILGLWTGDVQARMMTYLYREMGWVWSHERDLFVRIT